MEKGYITKEREKKGGKSLLVVIKIFVYFLLLFVEAVELWRGVGKKRR